MPAWSERRLPGGGVRVFRDGVPHVEVRESGVVPGQRGLFAARLFRAGDLIGEFKGQATDDPRASDSVVRRRNRQLVNTRGMGPPHLDMINSPKGSVRRANARLTQAATVRALRTIRPGVEVLMGYGRGYWR